MIKRSLLFSLFCVACLVFAACNSTKATQKQSTSEKISKKEIDSTTTKKVPAPKAKPVEEKEESLQKTPIPAPPIKIDEFRAGWVASVANINWPSKPGLSTLAQQQEALQILNFMESHNYNAVILQVRPQADALYESNLEPWSYFLTGEEGKAPSPYYDPLHFWINAAHQRGLELHVWLNPYRAHHTTSGEISEKAVIKKHPELAVKLENGMWWLDPAKKGTQDHAAAVVMDIVKRYDVDGVHFDDYFYPYDSYNKGKDFPDEESWKAYKAKGGELSRGNWRRNAVNTFIERVYKEIKAEKPYVKFGISPFGIWRPGYPESVKGYDQYEKLYADARLWLNNAWVDYFSPQLYWPINQFGQSFPELLGWWSSENTQNRHLWPGINVGLGGDEKNSDETINQIMITRGMLPKSPGTLHWSIGPMMKNKDVANALIEGPYRKKTLVPPSPWLDDEVPAAPLVKTSVTHNTRQISWTHPHVQDVFRWVLYFKYETGSWDYKIFNAEARSSSLQDKVGEKKIGLQEIGLTAVDRTGNQSEFKTIKLN